MCPFTSTCTDTVFAYKCRLDMCVCCVVWCVCVSEVAQVRVVCVCVWFSVLTVVCLLMSLVELLRLGYFSSSRHALSLYL